jgi:hypothetical protein
MRSLACQAKPQSAHRSLTSRLRSDGTLRLPIEPRITTAHHAAGYAAHRRLWPRTIQAQSASSWLPARRVPPRNRPIDDIWFLEGWPGNPGAQVCVTSSRVLRRHSVRGRIRTVLTSSSELAREKMWARIHLIPALQAEEDRDQVRRYLADKAREKELLGSETRVYNSDRYGVDLGRRGDVQLTFDYRFVRPTFAITPEHETK